MVGDVVTKDGEKRALESFGFAICQRMVSRSVKIGYTEYATQICEKRAVNRFSLSEGNLLGGPYSNPNVL